MAKFRVVILFVLAAAILVMAGCTTATPYVDVDPSLCATMKAEVVDGKLVCLEVGTRPTPAPITEPPVAAEGNENDLTIVPLQIDRDTPAPAKEEATPSVDLKSCGTIPDLSRFVGDPYGLIAKVDAQSAKVPVNSVPHTFTDRECKLFVTGAYNGENLPSGMEFLFVDGQTGGFLIREPVTVNFVGAYVPLALFDIDATVNEVDDIADGTMPVDVMVKLLNDFGRSDPEKFFRELDRLTNVEEAPYLPARYRPEPLGPKTYSELVSGSAVFWVQAGQVAGVEGQDFVVLVESHGKQAVLNLKDTLTLNYAHTGVQLDQGLDLASKVTWWGQ